MQRPCSSLCRAGDSRLHQSVAYSEWAIRLVSLDYPGATICGLAVFGHKMASFANSTRLNGDNILELTTKFKRNFLVAKDIDITAVGCSMYVVMTF